MTGLEAHPGSFRDPDARVMEREGRLFRVYTPAGARRAEAFAKTGLPARFESQGRLVPSLDAEIPPPEPGGKVVEHPRLPFVSFPYEWTFGMLRDAGRLELDLARESLEAGWGLKDATPYNVLFAGARPLHVDAASFAELPEGAPWIPYSQFCRLFLNPLLLTSLTGVPFQPWLRGRLDGLLPEELSSLLPLGRKLRRGVFRDVALQGWLNRKLAGGGAKGLAEAAAKVKVPRARVRGLLDRLRGTLERMRPPGGTSHWSRYEQECSIDAAALAFKDRWVEAALKEAGPGTVWDLGANTGRYSVMAAGFANQVVAFERDPAAAERLRERATEQHRANVLTLVMDLLDPSPGQGWEGRERPGLAARGRADFALCLALIHHVVIGGGLPLPRFLDWLAEVAPAGVVEFVPKEDPKVRELLRWREDVHPDYTRAAFEAELAKRVEVRERAELPGTARVLYRFGRR